MALKVKELKKIVDAYVRERSGEDEVVLVSEDGEVRGLGKRSFARTGKVAVRREYVKSCGWHMDCHTPGRSCLESHCRTCPDGGGVGYETSFRLDRRGVPVLALDVR